jgi:hypothetical protein
MSLNVNINISDNQYDTGNVDTASSPTKIKDTGWSGESKIVSLGGSLNITFEYTADPQSPDLIKPNENASTEIPKYQSNPEQNVAVTYYTTLADNLNELIDKYGLTKEQVSQLVFGHMTGQDPQDPALAKIAAELENLVAAQSALIGDGTLLNTALQEVKDAYNKSLTETYSESFEEHLATLALPPPKGEGLSKEDIAKLRFGFYNPDSADPSVKSKLDEIKATVLGEMSKDWGFPEGYSIPANSEKFAAELTIDFDTAFEGAVDEHIASLNLSEDEATTLKDQILYKHYNPGATMSDLVSQLTEQLEGKVKTEFATSYGIPSDYTIKPGFSYEAKINGMFSLQFDENLRNWDPPLDTDTLNAVYNALADPTNPNISKNIKNLIDSIFNKSVSQLRSQYHLPEDWMPDDATISELGKLNATTRLGLSAIESGEEQLRLMFNAVNSMSDGPGKTIYLNILKVVSDALAHLREQIATMQALDSELGSKLSDIQLETNLAKIQKQTEEIEAQRKQDAKMKPLQDFMKIMGPLKYLFMVVMAVLGGALLGPFGVMMALTMCAVLIADDVMGKNGPMKELFATIEKNVSPPGLAIFCKFLFAVACCIAGGPFLGSQVFFENAHIVQDILIACGVSPMVAACVNMALQLATDIVVMIILTFVSGGAFGAAMIANAVGRVGQLLEKAVKFTQTVIEKIVELIVQISQKLNRFANISQTLTQIASNLTTAASKLGNACEKVSEFCAKLLDIAKRLMKGGDVAEEAMSELKDVTNWMSKIMRTYEFSQFLYGVSSGTSTAVVNGMKASVVMTLAELDAEITQLEALVKNLRKIIQQMFEAMSGMADQYSDIGTSMAKLWSDRTQVASTVAGALEG